jgi:hypothetical protein
VLCAGPAPPGKDPAVAHGGPSRTAARPPTVKAVGVRERASISKTDAHTSGMLL